MKLGLRDVIDSALLEYSQGLYTAIPAKVIKITQDENGLTVDTQPMINRVEVDGEVFIPSVIPDVPVIMPAGGSAIINLPVAINDLVLLVFSMRAIDEFIVSDGVEPQTPFSKRSHSISDAIAITGLFTSKTAHSFDPDNLQLRNGKEDSMSQVTITQDGTVTINGASKVEIGEGATEALVMGTAFLKLFNQHTHPTGVGPSGPPTNLMVAGTHTSEYAYTK